MDANTWYYAAGQEQKGPFTVDQIKALLRDQVVNRDTYVWAPALSDWKPLAQTDLAPLLNAGPPMFAPAPPPSGGALASPGGPLAGPLAGLNAAAQGDGPQAAFVRAVQICLTQKYVDFRGRASRPEFWWFMLFGIIVSLIFTIVQSVLVSVLGLYFVGTIVSFISVIVNLALFLPNLGVMVRRLHDINRPGWWIAIPALLILAGLALAFEGFRFVAVLLAGLSLIAEIILLVFLCLQSDPAENRFGPPNPL